MVISSSRRFSLNGGLKDKCAHVYNRPIHKHKPERKENGTCVQLVQNRAWRRTDKVESESKAQI